MKLFYIIFCILQFLFTCHSFSQQGDNNRRVGTLNANNIKTIFTNTGIIGQPGNLGPKVAWKYDNNGYFSDLSFVIGIELPGKDYSGDNLPDIFQEVIFTPVQRPGGGNGNAIDGTFGGFEPTPGFFNPVLNKEGQGVAISTSPETWPEIWPDHPEYGINVWNGFFGKDSSAGDQEAYFQVNDKKDAKYYKLYKFLPDSSDTSRYGFGITVNIRYIELKNPLFKDVLFRIYDIKNESKFNYSKVVFGNLSGTYFGGAGSEYNDDATFFDSTNNIIYSWDKENFEGIPFVSLYANPGWIPNPYAVGFSGETFLQSPDNNKIGSYKYLIPASAIFMNSASQMWNLLTSYPNGSKAKDTLRGEDGDYIYSSSIFPLNSGETQRIGTVLAFGNNMQEVLSKIELAQLLWNNNFNIDDIFNEISFIEPIIHKTLSGTENIQWTSRNSEGFVDILISYNSGNTWINIIKNAPNTGSYLWNTALYNDCSFGKLKIIIKDNDKNIYGLKESNYFSINNYNIGAPFIKILNTEFDSTTIFTEKSHDFNLLIGDNKNDSVLCKVYYILLGDTNQYLSQKIYVFPDTNAQKIPVNFNDMTNSSNIRIKFEVTEGSKSFSDATPYFNKQTARVFLDSIYYDKIYGYTKVLIKINKVNPLHFTGDKYQISFDDTLSQTLKMFSVYDLTKNNYVLKKVPLIPFSESPVFDGLSLYAEDITTCLDTIRSRWNHEDNKNLNFTLTQLIFNTLNLRGYKYPFDYMIVFSDSYADSSNMLYKVFGSIAPPSKIINFKIYDITNSLNPTQIQFGFAEAINFRNDTLSYLDRIFLSDQEGKAISWIISFFGDSTSNIPKGGDTLFLFTQKGISHYDTLEIFGLPVGVKPSSQLSFSYYLNQNYPNPFNPTTIIEFSIPSASSVSLKVYNILGEEVTTLVNEFKLPGTYKVKWEAYSYTTGIYFYQLRAGNFVQTKKLILMK